MQNTENKAWKISVFRRILLLVLCFAGGTLYAAALPPLNWNMAVFVSLLPVLYCGYNFKWKFSLLCGWIWGLGWAVFSYQFLREIEFFIPYLISPVLAIWPALWAALLPRLKEYIFFPAESLLWNVKRKNEYLARELPWYRTVLFTIAAATIFTMIEWTRSRLFVWNDLSVTQWRNTYIIQIAALTGSYGIGFFIVLVNCGISAALFCKRNKIAALILPLLSAAGIILFSIVHVEKIKSLPAPEKTLRAGLVQCDLSQRRHATLEQAVEAVNVCVSLSEQCAALKPEIIIWPESAVPLIFNGSGSVYEFYRRKFGLLLRETNIPILAGMLTFKADPAEKTYSVTNSALLFNSDCTMAGRYDKIHRVPFGEYIPFRKYLPESIINAVDMGRDLKAGTNYEPINITPEIRASVAICYEGVFGYLMRQFAQRNSDLYIVVSNDAWYPESSEPEQHLANSVIRCVENGMFMIRCGNNGGSGVVTPDGKFTRYIGSNSQRPELLRERAVGVVEVPIYKNREKTFFVKYGEWFILILTAISVLTAAYCVINEFERRKYSKQLYGETNESGNNRNN